MPRKLALTSGMLNPHQRVEHYLRSILYRVLPPREPFPTCYDTCFACALVQGVRVSGCQGVERTCACGSTNTGMSLVASKRTSPPHPPALPRICHLASEYLYLTRQVYMNSFVLGPPRSNSFLLDQSWPCPIAPVIPRALLGLSKYSPTSYNHVRTLRYKYKALHALRSKLSLQNPVTYTAADRWQFPTSFNLNEIGSTNMLSRAQSA
jgi:hypothetical protein